MITIFSISNDQTTTEVLRWIIKDADHKFIRINSDLSRIKFKNINSNLDTIIIKKGDKEIDLKKTTVSWYRKGKVLFADKLKLNLPTTYFGNNDRYLANSMRNELNTLSDFIHFEVERTSNFSLGSNFNSSLNKLQVLSLAKEAGLKIPNTFVVESKEALIELLNNSSIITKALSDGVYLFVSGYAYYSYTEKIDINNLDNLPNTFFPSLIQHEIDKKYEIRVFYLEGTFYAMAILSQRDEKTKVDFRKYNGEKPNRYVPYMLPDAISKSLGKLFEKLQLNTGSVDLIKDKSGNYIFLEINPVGQFSMVSYPCNYYLEKEVANLLITKQPNHEHS